MIKDIIFNKAKSVRDWAESLSVYKDLTGWCAICSFEIFIRLKKANLKPVFGMVS